MSSASPWNDQIGNATQLTSCLLERKDDGGGEQHRSGDYLVAVGGEVVPRLPTAPQLIPVR